MVHFSTNLPEQVLKLLDKDCDNKISINVASELSKLPNNIDCLEVLNKITNITNEQKIEVIKKFKRYEEHDIDLLDDIKKDVVIEYNNLQSRIQCPWVLDNHTGDKIRIPDNMFSEIVDLIKIKTKGNYVTL